MSGPAFPNDVTIRDKYRPAMSITDPEAAMEYLEKCIEHTMRFGRTREEARRIELGNLGYYAGYYSHETQARVQSLFGAVHPIFGSFRPTPEEAFDAGRQLAERDR